VPIIIEEAFDYYCTKYQVAYVNNFKGMVKDSALEEKSVKEIILEGQK
jgi:superoxide dismutase